MACRTCTGVSRWLLPPALLWGAFAGVGESVPGQDAILLDRVLQHSQGWGELGIGSCAHAAHLEPLPLQIGEVTYQQGLGHHAPGEILIDLGGEFAWFEAEVGVQKQNQGAGSVVFQVFVDGDKRYDSGVMREADAPKKIRIPVNGGYDLRLAVTDAGDGIVCDCANWVNLNLVADPASSAGSNPSSVDVAPFAQVVSSDPKRQEGARADRTEEFLAEDVFLTTAILPDSAGRYTVPGDETGLGCIGLEWAERRFLRKVALTFEGPPPMAEKVTVQFWTGESPWQGRWQTVEGDSIASATGWILPLSLGKNPDLKKGTERIRWIFPVSEESPKVRSLSAFTTSLWQTTDLHLWLDSPLPGQTASLEGYNGWVRAREGSDWARTVSWDLGAPIDLTVRYCKTRGWKTDRTVLRLKFPETAFGVSVDDLLENGFIHAPHAGLWISKKGFAVPSDLLTATTLLHRVRQMPDQTLEQAFEKVHNPVQEKGPMMLSLATDNRKFVAYREGDIVFDPGQAPDDPPTSIPTQRKIAVRFGDASLDGLSRHLEGDWLPIPVLEIPQANGITYCQRTCVVPFDDESLPDSNGWLYSKALCVSEFFLKNASQEKSEASLNLGFITDLPNNRGAELRETGQGIAAVDAGGNLLAFLDLREARGLKATLAGGEATLAGEIEPHSEAKVSVLIPAWTLAPEEAAALLQETSWFEECAAYWNRVMAPSMKIEVPDRLLNLVIRASQVHCLLAARNEEGGKRIAAWISSDRYGPLESEAHAVIRGMDLVGQSEFARRSLEFFVHRYDPKGYLTTGYTLMGTGWHLWTLAEYFQRSGDEAWLRGIAPQVAKVCQWVVDQRHKTEKLDGQGERVPEYGLVPPGVAADWNRFAYRFFQEGHYYAGLSQAAQALLAVGFPQASDLIADAKSFREDILRAYRYTQARSPLLELADQTWVPAYPSIVECFGKIEDLIPGEDATRSWAYDVELGAHHLVLHGLLDPDSFEVDAMMNHMEDFWFLHSGWFDYPEEKNRADWYNLGGWAKVQPYYARNAEICALRDDIKPFIRSYFNTIPTLLSLENLSFWEHFNNSGGWNKTHETGYFLAQSRLMLVMERGDDLWLAPFVTDNWLKDGMTVSVKDAPTVFGPVTYDIHSHVGEGFIQVTISPPTRNAPEHVVLRLRHPDGKPIGSAKVEGAKEFEIDREKECIRIVPEGKAIRVRAEF